MISGPHVELAAAIALLARGIQLVYRHWRPRRPQLRVVSTTTRATRRVSAHQLGLAHRLAARLLGSRWRPPDEEFAAAAAIWPTYPMPGRWGTRLVALYSPELGRYVTPARSMLELEELLEQLETLNARIRNWRPGRRRERR